MARSSNLDPIEKFRFSVIMLDNFLDPVTLLDTIVSNFAGISRAGFSEVTLPTQSINTVEYRENNDPMHVQYLPGLGSHDPVTLRRGVTDSSDFYQWMSQVHDSTQVLANSIQRIRGDSERFPGNSKHFRKDLLIIGHNRAGEPVKGWLLYNCWPSSYKPGDDFSAMAEEKLVEEITVVYESFEEISKDSLISGAFSAVLDLING